MVIFLLIVIAALMFKLGVLTVIVSILSVAGQFAAFVISIFIFSYLFEKFIGRKGKKSVHVLRKDQWWKS
jgi:membrane protein implicated in regulation of membrane protease activity